MADLFRLSELATRLDFTTVPEVWPELARRIEAGGRLQVSLQGITEANSAALALLLEGLELARRRGCRLEYLDLPASLLELARMSNVDRLLAGGERTAVAA